MGTHLPSGTKKMTVLGSLKSAWIWIRSENSPLVDRQETTKLDAKWKVIDGFFLNFISVSWFFPVILL